MEVFARLIELKPESTQRVDDWAKFIAANRDEAINTLRNEGVQVESWFALTLEGKQYLLCYMRVESWGKAQAAAEQSDSLVDAYHQQFKVDAWVRGAGTMGKLLVDLTQ